MKLVISLSLCIFSIISFSQESVFVENINQWEKEVQYETEIKGGNVYFTDNSLVFDLYDLNQFNQLSEDIHHQEYSKSVKLKDAKLNRHSYKWNLINSNNFNWLGTNKFDYHYNYFLGNDKSKWASNVPLYQEIKTNNVYKNIDLKTSTKDGNLKYDFIVHPGGDVSSIKMNYQGIEEISIYNNRLKLSISYGEIIEQEPYVYQIINGIKIEISSSYKLKNGVVSYEIGDYNSRYDLIIDPTVIASTYSGSTSTIYGHTATFDSSGNIYSAGAGFSPGGLPVTTGAYQTTFGGNREMCILKYNQTGSALIYATYLGGSSSDYPHSMFDYNNNLYVLGSSESSDFPVTTGAYDVTHNGQSDIVVTVLNPTGSALLGSTYVGGSNDDGRNVITPNYGDRYRGEIIVDGNGNAYVSTSSSSNDFPTTANAFQSTHGGSQDGVAIKLNPTLTNLSFSTYLGGASDDSGFGVKVNGSTTYICGSAGTSFFTPPSGSYSNYNGGRDSYVVALNSNATAITSGTYFGTTSDEEAYFIEIDGNNDVYILGLTSGSINSTPGRYSRGNKLYVAKFNSTLTNLDYVSASNDMAPVAFLVDNCGNIYISGHGGLSSLNGTFELTAGFFQLTPAGFYLMVLNPNATGLLFGTYYGGSGSHVDGGTSRFDKKGIVYQATCTSMGFPTNTNAYATTGAAGFDVTVFKIDFDFLNSEVSFVPSPEDETVRFKGEFCYDIVAFSNGEDTFEIDIASNAFDFGAFLTLPPRKNNLKYDFYWNNTTTSSKDTTFDVSPIKISERKYAGIRTTGVRFCWKPEMCEILEIDTFKIDLFAVGRGCDGIIDTSERTINIIVDNPSIPPHEVPNVFSPNNDGINDIYRLNPASFDECIDVLTVKIYNRWGQLIFESDDPQFEWDGKTNEGKEVSPGTYFIILQGFYGSREVTDQFTVNLFR